MVLQDAGAQHTALNLFQLPISVLRATFNGISEDILLKLVNSAVKVTPTIALDPVCVYECKKAGKWKWDGKWDEKWGGKWDNNQWDGKKKPKGWKP